MRRYVCCLFNLPFHVSRNLCLLQLPSFLFYLYLASNLLNPKCVPITRALVLAISIAILETPCSQVASAVTCINSLELFAILVFAP